MFQFGNIRRVVIVQAQCANSSLRPLRQVIGGSARRSSYKNRSRAKFPLACSKKHRGVSAFAARLHRARAARERTRAFVQRRGSKVAVCIAPRVIFLGSRRFGVKAFPRAEGRAVHRRRTPWTRPSRQTGRTRPGVSWLSFGTETPAADERKPRLCRSGAHLAVTGIVRVLERGRPARPHGTRRRSAEQAW